MKIKTCQPLMKNHIEITQLISTFWDKISLAWRDIWGPHIHHGFYEDDHAISPIEAQELLIEKITNLLTIRPQARILDVGCGMGGSSLVLAKKYNANVTGVTISAKQRSIAEHQAYVENVQNVNFKIENALSLSSIANKSIDIVWSLESCEQFYDKNLFLKQAFRVLKPGGQLMLATWCSSQEEFENQLAKKYRKLCYAFDLPYMPTFEHYQTILKNNGYNLKQTLDWSHYVEKSWDMGISLVNAYSFFQLLKKGGWRGLQFAKQIKLMRDAFRNGTVKYGVFIATKPNV